MKRTTNWRVRTALAAGLVACVAGMTAPAMGATAGQITKGELGLKELDLLQLPRLDIAQLTNEDQLRAVAGEAPRFAVPTDVRITPDTDGTWENLGDDMWVWRLTIRSPEALSINFGFTDYHLPKGATLDLYGADGLRQIRGFTGLDNMDHGQLWTPPIMGDTVTMQLVIPGAQLDAYRLVLGSVNSGYRGFGSGIVARSGSCNLDVICGAADGFPANDLWRDEMSATAVISTGGTTFCTGFMVNNTSQDKTPFFMTANHCGINAGNAASLVTFWNYENSTCRAPGSAASGGIGDGSLAQFITGSTHLAGFATSDFTLVQLSSAPPQAWEISFAGWDSRDQNPAAAVGIHHPSTDEKRISYENNPLLQTVGFVDTPTVVSGDHMHIADWDVGTTEGGSSGSSLFDAATHRIIGQLHGGGAACGNNLFDSYGAFHISYDRAGATAANSLKPWLDPTATGALFIDTLPGAGFSVTPGADTLHEGVVGGPFSNSPVAYTLTNNSAAALNYEVRIVAGGQFPLLINGGPGPVNGSLAGGGGSVLASVEPGAAVTALAAGTYVTTVEFEDQTNLQTFSRTHTLEVGATGFTVTPATDLASGGPVGGPFAGSQVYTITSTKPAPVTVQVGQSANWISVDGATVAQSYILPGVGSFVNVTVGLDATNSAALLAGVQNGIVSFTNLSGGTGDTTRNVVLDVGRFLYPATDVPQPIADNVTTVSTITVPDDFCVGDVDVDMDISHTFIGDLRVTLTSPDGVVVTLHDRTGGTTDDILLTYDDEGLTPPDLPALSDFDTLSAMGVWTLSVTDNANGDTGTLNGWTLRVADSGAAICSSNVVFASFPLNTDEGWAGVGGWAWGVPTGGAGTSGAGDPISGFTGLNVWGYNLLGGYPNNLGVEHLTTTAVNCTGRTGVRVNFQRWLGVESASFDHAAVDVSSDGVLWTNVWDHIGGAIDESSWNAQSIDISAVADNQPTVFVRWAMGTTDGSVTYHGWNIDDVEFTSLIVLACQGDADSDGDTDLGDLNTVLFNFGNVGAPGIPGDVTGDGLVDLVDLNTVLFNFGCV